MEGRGDHRPADRPLVRGQDKKAAPGQGELFPAYRYHATFTDTPFELVQAEEHHHGHAIIEQVFADWNDDPLAHLPVTTRSTRRGWMRP